MPEGAVRRVDDGGGGVGGRGGGGALGKDSVLECKLPVMRSIRSGGEKFSLLSVTSLDRLEAVGGKRASAADTAEVIQYCRRRSSHSFPKTALKHLFGFQK